MIRKLPCSLWCFWKVIKEVINSFHPGLLKLVNLTARAGKTLYGPVKPPIHQSECSTKARAVSESLTSHMHDITNVGEKSLEKVNKD